MSLSSRKNIRDAYSRYYPLIFSVLYTKLGNREDAEDICQEVFIRFVNKFEEIASHRKWLLAAIPFEISNFYRKKKDNKYNSVDIDDLKNDVKLAFENGFRDARIIIQDAIENMDNFRDETEKLLFDLVAVYNFSYKEAGKYLKITRDRAEYVYRQTEKRILQYLKSKGIKEIGDIV